MSVGVHAGSFRCNREREKKYANIAPQLVRIFRWKVCGIEVYCCRFTVDLSLWLWRMQSCSVVSKFTRFLPCFSCYVWVFCMLFGGGFLVAVRHSFLAIFFSVCERVYTFLFLVIDSLFQHSSTSSAISVTPCLVQVVTFVMPCKIHNYHVFMCACKFALDKFTLNVHNKRDERKKERKEKRNQTDQSQVCAFSHFIWKICKTHCVLYGVTTWCAKYLDLVTHSIFVLVVYSFLFFSSLLSCVCVCVWLLSYLDFVWVQ